MRIQHMVEDDVAQRLLLDPLLVGLYRRKINIHELLGDEVVFGRALRYRPLACREPLLEAGAQAMAPQPRLHRNIARRRVEGVGSGD